MAMTDLVITDPTTFAFNYPSWVARVSTAMDFDLPGRLDSVQPKLWSDISSNMKPVFVSRSAGGHQVDYADFVTMNAEPTVNVAQQPTAFSKMVDIIFPDTNRKRAFLGDYTEENNSVDSEERGTSRIEFRPYLFGRVFGGMRMRHNAAGPIQQVTGTDVILNPMVDGIVYGNMSDIKENDTYLWMDPEIGQSDAAKAFHAQEPSEWTIFEAIRSICNVCNKDEFFVRNPVMNEANLIWINQPLLRDVRFATGKYLPYYLDELLHPNGYNWRIEYNQPFIRNTFIEDLLFPGYLEYPKPIIEVFRRGYSTKPPKQLKFQAPNTILNLSLSNVNAYAIRRRIADAVTAVRVLGDELRAEITIPLYPGWAQASDALTDIELAIQDGASYPNNKLVHRLWVANEGADYTGLRAGLYPIGDPPNLDAIFAICASADGAADPVRYETKTIARRRMIEPPLTFQGAEGDRVRRELLLQFSVDSGGTWTEVTNEIGGWAVLGDRIAIIFTDNLVPIEIYQAFAGGDLRMRLTGTIKSDHTLYNVGADTYTLGSVQGRENLVTLDLRDRFRHWFVLGQGHPDRPELNAHPLKSVLKDDIAGADVYDDRAAIIKFGQDIIRPMLNAEYDGTFIIPGWTDEYEIGDLLSEINGRNISLNQAAIEAPPLYMQVTGVEWSLSDEDGPETKLIVDRGTREYSAPGFTPKRGLADQAGDFAAGVAIGLGMNGPGLGVRVAQIIGGLFGTPPKTNKFGSLDVK